MIHINQNDKNRFTVVGVTIVDSGVTSGVKAPLHLKFPMRLRELLDMADRSQAIVGNLAGVNQVTVSLWETSKQLPRVDRCERIALALSVKPSWLAYGPEGAMRFRQRRSLPPGARLHPLPILRPATEIPLGSAGLPARLRSAREALGLSLRALGAAAGTSGQGIMIIERGDVLPGINTVEALAVALDVAPGWLAFGDGEGPETWAN